MGYLCAEVVLSLSSGREIVFRGSVSDDQPRFAARARDGEAIATLEFAEGQLIAVCTTTSTAKSSDAGARRGGSASGGAPLGEQPSAASG